MVVRIGEREVGGVKISKVKSKMKREAVLQEL